MKKVFLPIIMLFIGYSYCSAQFSLTDSLYAYYPFNGNANDASGHGHNPIYNTASLSADQNGHMNSAYTFGGNDSMIINNFTYQHQNLQGMSVSFWMKTSGASGLMALVSPSPEVVYIGRFTKNHIMTAFDANSSNNQTTDESMTDVSTNKWIYVAATNDGSETRIFINGTLEKSYPETLYPTPTNDKFMMGYYHNPAAGFEGSLDEVRVYTRALSAQEISQLYKLGTPTGINGNTPSLQAEVYPNPTASGMFALQFGKPVNHVKLTVCDLAGKTIRSAEAENISTCKMDLSACPKGIYVLHIVSSQGIVDKRLIIE